MIGFLSEETEELGEGDATSKLKQKINYVAFFSILQNCVNYISDGIRKEYGCKGIIVQVANHDLWQCSYVYVITLLYHRMCVHSLLPQQ